MTSPVTNAMHVYVSADMWLSLVIKLNSSHQSSVNVSLSLLTVNREFQFRVITINRHGVSHPSPPSAFLKVPGTSPQAPVCLPQCARYQITPVPRLPSSKCQVRRPRPPSAFLKVPGTSPQSPVCLPQSARYQVTPVPRLPSSKCQVRHPSPPSAFLKVPGTKSPQSPVCLPQSDRYITPVPRLPSSK